MSIKVLFYHTTQAILLQWQTDTGTKPNAPVSVCCSTALIIPTDTTEIVFKANWKSFLFTVKRMFQGLEHTFHSLERMFHYLECTFHLLEHNIHHREKTFIALCYNNLSTMFQKCGKYAGKQSLWNAGKRCFFLLSPKGLPLGNTQVNLVFRPLNRNFVLRRRYYRSEILK